MNITVERNIAADTFAAKTYPYIARIEMSSTVTDKTPIYQVPIFVHYAGIKKQFSVDICGFRLEASKPHALIGEISQLLRGIMNAARMPTYVFIARRARAVFPVYTVDDEVFATTAIGPVFRHVELAKVRDYLTDYLHDANILGKNGLSDKLHVRGISKSTLGLRRPVFYLKKRVPGEVDFWAPVFQSSDGQTIYTYAASSRRDVARQDGEVLFLQEEVARCLQADGRLRDPLDLRPDRLLPGYWQRLQPLLTLAGETAVFPQSICLYQYQSLWLGVEERKEEERVGLFYGRSQDDLLQRIRTDFQRRGLL